MWRTPIRLRPLEINIHADRCLAFQVLTAFGASASGEGASSKVLERDGSRTLVEFHTPGRDLLGRRRTYRTIEWVTPREPDLVEFEGVEGPLDMLHDRFTLVAEGGCTRLIYESEFGMKGWLAGCLMGVLVVRPMLKRMMQKHLTEMKNTIEARAKRSRLYPKRPCAEEDHRGD